MNTPYNNEGETTVVTADDCYNNPGTHHQDVSTHHAPCIAITCKTTSMWADTLAKQPGHGAHPTKSTYAQRDARDPSARHGAHVL